MRTPRATLAALLLLGPLAACTADDGPSPEAAADDLAAALTAGRLDSALFEGVPRRAPQRAWDEATEGLSGATPEVTAGGVTEDASGDTATATLSYAWDLPGTDDTWDQDATARLVRAEDGSWRVRLLPEVFGLHDR